MSVTSSRHPHLEGSQWEPEPQLLSGVLVAASPGIWSVLPVSRGFLFLSPTPQPLAVVSEFSLFCLCLNDSLGLLYPSNPSVRVGRYFSVDTWNQGPQAGGAEQPILREDVTSGSLGSACGGEGTQTRVLCLDSLMPREGDARHPLIGVTHQASDCPWK